MYISIAVLILIVGTIIIERTSRTGKSSEVLVPVRVDNKRNFRSPEKKWK